MKALLLFLLVALSGLLQAEHPSCYINLITIEGTVANQIRIQVRDQDAGTFTYTVHIYVDDPTKTSVTDVLNFSVAAGGNTTYAITGATFGTGTKNLRDGQQHKIYFSCDTQTLGTIAPAAGDAWLYKWNVAGGVADYSYPLYTTSGRGAMASNLALVFNPNDPYSVGVSGSTVCTVGGTAVKSDGVVGSYVTTWGVPCANVHKFATAWSSTTTDITATQFASDYAAITPAFSASEQYIALGFMLPVRVTGITATGTAGTVTNEMMSITGAFANGGTLIAPTTLTTLGIVAGGEHLQGNPMFRTSSLTPFSTYGKRPTAMLAWAKCDGGGTGENCSTVGSTGVAGNWTADIATAQAGITAAKNAVNTNPTSGQVYVQSNSGDFGRSAGYGLASPLAFGNQTAVAPTTLNVTTTALISTGSQITQTNLLGYELAAVGPSTAAASTPTMIAAGTAYFLARTSASGMLAGGSQTPATWYLLKGAVFSAGSINEPYGTLSTRFPEMMLFQSRYTRGATAIEAAWASTRDPWETVFVGDPLASPFALSTPTPAPTRQVLFAHSALQAAGCSPITVLQAGTMSYPLSFLASGQTSVITPSVTGLPATCAATFSPATVPAGGGATTLNMTCGYTAPLGSYVLTLGGETSTNVSTTVSQTLIVGRALYYISSVAPVLASPAALTGSLDYVASPVYVNGSTGNWNTWRAGGTLFSHTITVANIQPNFPSTPTPFTWTGSNNGTGSSAVSLGNYNFVASASSMVASMTTDASIRTVTLYGGWTGGGSGVVTVTAHLSSGAAPDEVSVFTVPSGLSYNQALTAKWVFTIKDSTAGILSLTMTSTTTPAVLQAITVN